MKLSVWRRFSQQSRLIGAPSADRASCVLPGTPPIPALLTQARWLQGT